MSSATTFEVGVATLTDVDAISRIAFDVRDMAAHLERGEFLDARRIYEEGRHSPQYDIYGEEEDEYLSLRRMARAGKDGMFDEDPTYMFQMLGMADSRSSAEDAAAAHGQYADSYVTELLNDYTSETLGAQASTVLIVSMYAAHQLWDGLLDCFAVYNGFNAEADRTGRINPKQAFDNFIALYVGAGQTLAPDWEGDMLYELAQAGGGLFGTTDVEGEATVNSEIRQLYQSIQRTLSEEDYCKRDESIKTLWRLSHRIIARTHVPMVQMLIHSMRKEDQALKVKMYALAVVPQLSRCRPSIHGRLKNYLLDKAYDKRDFDRIVELLEQSYDCLGFSCADVGAYEGGGDGAAAPCAGPDWYPPMADFLPMRDVRSLARADLDIRAIDQLLRFPSSTQNRMAQLYFKYGGHAAIDDDDGDGFPSMSLRDMTRSSDEREWSPYYDSYVEYFGRERNDDSAVARAFDDGDADPDQRRAFVVSSLRYNVVPEYMMSLIGYANQLCVEEDGDESAPLYWDAFAALYIGSMEGAESSNSNDDGLMLWSIANNGAREFDTQNDRFTANVNDEMTDLLYAGQGQLERKDCINFGKTFSRVLHLMLVPLIQTTIYYASVNERLGRRSADVTLANGEAAAFSVLPIVSNFDRTAAAVIERNMVRDEWIEPVEDGARAVADAFYKILDDVGWGCEYIGRHEGIGACEQFNGKILEANGSTPVVARRAVTLLVILASAIWGISIS